MEEAEEEPVLPAEAIEGREEFHRAVLTALNECAHADIAQLWLCDRDFAQWPLGQPQVLEALTRWIGSKKQLTLIAADYGAFASRFPRFPRWVHWRRQWSHAVSCRAAHDEVADQVPTLLLAPGLTAVRLNDPLRLRGRVYRGVADLSRCRDLVDALLQRTDESFPVTTLGL